MEEPISDRELSKIMEVYDDNINNKEGRNRSRINHRSKGRKKHKSDEVEITIIQTNCYGYTSKKESFDDIVKENAPDPDIVVIQETALKEKEKKKIKDYFSFCKNREKEKGGVGTLVADYLKSDTTKVAEGTDGDKYLIKRLDHVIPAINIVNTS